MAKTTKPDRVDPTWIGDDDNGSHPVTELTSDRQGALSPFGNTTFPLDTTPYVHPTTEINR
ncbi:hypothetical protein [Actinokineospora cianjurensis]|uniref:Uncharacterized protein n=1 Tax=Actinokineospora cianjurensis TaxID=585224 RepID=A0A421B5Y4_9PSEU|nr:hypothetical protein [Actinokineospora cianjurensis]RLK59705.1 hypothetical protein CLV68_0189 [Actinokineospora cianjurensis]